MIDSNLRKPRNSSIELLRIIAMLFIIMGHFITQTRFSQVSSGINGYLLTIMGNGSRIAVNIFLLIGAWFMVDSEKKIGKRILTLYIPLYVYCSSITIVSSILFGIDSKIEAIRGFVPFFGRALWFISAYITLLFMAPFLKKVLALSKKRLTILVMLCFVFMSIVSTLPDNQINYVSDSLWFWFVYLAIGCFKMYYYEDFKRIFVRKRIALFAMGGDFTY